MPEATLIIDDDATFNAVLVRTLERRGHPARGVADPVAALAVAAELVPARVVLDLNLNGSSGLALIPRLLAINPDCRVVVLTGYASITTAVDAIKLGAVQYLAKPVEIEAILGAFENDDDPDLDMVAPDEPLSVDRLEWEHIQRVLNENEGNISATARALKMHRRTLQRKLSKRPVRT
ncbi:MAG TPA: response regulator [Azonexus sp.]|jgi:two-component system response regulator RegA|nr:response regulator [Azonexus sp.]